jgi:hypothetical protein
MLMSGSLGAGCLAHAGNGTASFDVCVSLPAESGLAVCALSMRHTVVPFAAFASCRVSARLSLIRLYQQSAGGAVPFSKPAT